MSDLADDASDHIQAQKNAAAEKAIETSQKQLQKKMIEAAVETTAMQMSASIALLCIPVVGWAAEAIMAVWALMTYLAAQHVKAAIKKIMADLKKAVSVKQKAVEADVHAVEDKISTEVFPAAQALAISNTPINGLGDIWQRIGGGIKKAAKVVVKVHVAPIKAAGHETLKAAASISKAVGAKGLSKTLESKERVWDNVSAHAEKYASDRLGDPRQIANDLRGLKEMMTGEVQIRKAQEGADKIKAKVFAMLELNKSDTLARMATAEYRDTLTKNIARSIRNDPKMLEDAQFYVAQQEKLAVKNGLSPDAQIPNVTGSNAGFLASLAALGAVFMLKS